MVITYFYQNVTEIYDETVKKEKTKTMKFIFLSYKWFCIAASVCFPFWIDQVQGDCGVLPTVANSYNNADPGPTYPSGTTVIYSCNIGYVPSGDDTITCSGDTWETPGLTCTARVCGDPGHPHNGRRIGTVYSFGHYVNFECYEGYTLDGYNTSYCQSDGTWSKPVPTCNVVRCGPYDAPDYGTVFPTQEVDYGEQVRFQCNKGYIWTGTKDRACQADGTLSGKDGICEEARCDDPTTQDDHLTFEGSTKAGESIMFECLYEARMEGSEFAQCLESTLQWSEEPPKCIRRCKAPDLQHGTWNGEEWTNDGDIATLQCDEFFQGPSTVTCHNGSWRDAPNCKSIVSHYFWACVGISMVLLLLDCFILFAVLHGLWKVCNPIPKDCDLNFIMRKPVFASVVFIICILLGALIVLLILDEVNHAFCISIAVITFVAVIITCCLHRFITEYKEIKIELAIWVEIQGEEAGQKPEMPLIHSQNSQESAPLNNTGWIKDSLQLNVHFTFSCFLQETRQKLENHRLNFVFRVIEKVEIKEGRVWQKIGKNKEAHGLVCLPPNFPSHAQHELGDVNPRKDFPRVRILYLNGEVVGVVKASVQKDHLPYLHVIESETSV